MYNCFVLYPKQREWDGWAHKPGIYIIIIIYSIQCLNWALHCIV